MAVFDVIAQAYDGMIDWEKRLARETPLYRSLFEKVSARRVLDAACGTGRHAAMFASWGLDVEGADINAGMIDYCRRTYTGEGAPKFVERSFLEVSPSEFDVVVCVGNSLALLDSEEQVSKALASLVNSTRKGGSMIVHVLNVEARTEGPVQWDKHLRLTIDGGDYLVTKGIHRAGNLGYVDFLMSRLDVTPVHLESHSAAFISLHSDWLLDRCRELGCHRADVYGNYRMDPFDASRSSDLILVALR